MPEETPSSSSTTPVIASLSQAVLLALKSADSPLNATDILQWIRDNNIVETTGKTPDRTISTYLTREFAKKGITRSVGHGRHELSPGVEIDATGKYKRGAMPIVNSDVPDEEADRREDENGMIVAHDTYEDGAQYRLTLPREVLDSLYFDYEFGSTLLTLLERKKQVIFAGPPGTGKTYAATKLIEALIEAPQQMSLVQFHPSYTYEDFFEGYRPVPSSEAASQSGGLSLALRPGPLKLIAERARQDPERPYFLVIDELNRGNLAQIFGEMYFLLEYRDKEVTLMYSGERFSLPENLYFIGTMNSADRSITMIDAAMRRRFGFLRLDPDTEPTKSLLTKWAADREKEEGRKPKFWLPNLWAKLNNDIFAESHDKSLLIGPSYFIDPALAHNEALLRLVWDSEIIPLLMDSMFDQKDVADTFNFDKLIEASSSQADPVKDKASEDAQAEEMDTATDSSEQPADADGAAPVSSTDHI